MFCCTFLCDQETDTDGRCVIKPDRKRINEASFVKLKTWFDKSIRSQLKGEKDDWAHDVRKRVETVSCLPAEEAVSYSICLQLLSLQHKQPSNDINNEVVYVKRTKGMKVQNKAKNGAFLKLIEFIEEWKGTYYPKTMSREDDGICEWTVYNKTVKRTIKSAL